MKRKGFDGNLKACELLEMMQYRCDVEENPTRKCTMRCWQVPRLFRRCVAMIHGGVLEMDMGFC